MKKIVGILLIGICSQLWAQNAPTGNPQKRALIIAISDYPDETGWADLSSDKDVQLLKPVLVRQGFSDIALLENKDASHDGMVSAINKLIQDCRPGDIVYIHYSG